MAGKETRLTFSLPHLLGGIPIPPALLGLINYSIMLVYNSQYYDELLVIHIHVGDISILTSPCPSPDFRRGVRGEV